MKTQDDPGNTSCAIGTAPDMSGIAVLELAPPPALKDYLGVANLPPSFSLGMCR